MKIIITCIIYLCDIINFIYAQPHIIDGYTDKLSYRSGETITFFINASNPGYMDIYLYKMNGSIAATISSVDVTPQLYPGGAYWQNGFGYTASTATWTVPSQSVLPSGRYLINTANADFQIPIIIKGDKNVAGGIVVLIPTNTDEAYNTFHDVNNIYGAHSLYDPDPNDPLHTIPIVSFLRPMQSHQHDHYDGFLKWFLAAGYGVYNINFISDKDMDDYSEIENAKLLMVIGHSEYWTRQARLNFDSFVDNGLSEVGYRRNAIVLSGNTMWWQVRYNVDQLVCFRGNSFSDATHQLTTDPFFNTDPLKATITWWDPVLKYSTISSIGGDSHFGYAGNGAEHNTTPTSCHSGFNGYKIVQEDSPLLTGTNLHNGVDVIKLSSGEFDLTQISNADATDGHIIGNNGIPILDQNALGFYRAELIAYDQTTSTFYPQGDGAMKYAPLMVFQKNSTSGNTIVASTNDWCLGQNIYGIYIYTADDNQPCNAVLYLPDGQYIRTITSNMIDKLFVNDDDINNPVFSPYTPEPTSFTIKPSAYNVSYVACQDGSVHITPGGVYLNNAYKIDNDDGTAKVYVDNNCSTYSAARLAANSSPHSSAANEAPAVTFQENARLGINNSKNSIQIFPNPTSGNFNIYLQGNKVARDIIVYNMLGQPVWQQMNVTESSFSINISSYPKGLYWVKVICSGVVSTSKLVYL